MQYRRLQSPELLTSSQHQLYTTNHPAPLRLCKTTTSNLSVPLSVSPETGLRSANCVICAERLEKSVLASTDATPRVISILCVGTGGGAGSARRALQQFGEPSLLLRCSTLSLSLRYKALSM